MLNSCSIEINNIFFQLQSCPTFMVSLNGFYPEPKETILMQYIKEISQLDTFIIVFIPTYYLMLILFGY